MNSDNFVFDDSVDSSDLIRFADAYSGLGHVVQQQVKLLLDSDWVNINPNAVSMIEDRLRGMHEDLDNSIKDYREFFQIVGNRKSVEGS